MSGFAAFSSESSTPFACRKRTRFLFRAFPFGCDVVKGDFPALALKVRYAPAGDLAGGDIDPTQTVLERGDTQIFALE